MTIRVVEEMGHLMRLIRNGRLKMDKNEVMDQAAMSAKNIVEEIQKAYLKGYKKGLEDAKRS